jgi:CDP-glucose 4,6-dehydratase
LTHLQQVTSDCQPEIVMHLAAQALVRKSYQFPVETYSTNVMGTVHLLEAVRQVGGVRAFVCVTSDKCYHNRNWVWSYREDDLLGGYDPYSISKACAELVTGDKGDKGEILAGRLFLPHCTSEMILEFLNWK